MADEPGAISAEEYQRLAAELTATHKQNLLRLQQRRRETNRVLSKNNIVAKAFAKFRSIAAEQKLTVTADTVAVDAYDPTELADITIVDVHKLPQRQRFNPPADDSKFSCSAAMRKQQDTGKYPTIAEHLAEKTPLYKAAVDKHCNQIRADGTS